jgi:predicted NBD/HSP70 family sugar kinase
MITGSKELIRDINNNIVLETIINSVSISRASLAKKLGLTKATISTIVQELIYKDLVQEIGSGNTSLGRKPILLSFNKTAGYTISIDLGVENISALLTNLRGEKYQLKQIKTPKDTSALIDVLIGLIESMKKLAPQTTYGLIGLSLGIHGIVSNNKVIFAPYYTISGIQFSDELERYFDIPVTLENEANLSVIGEKTFIYDYPNIANISVHAGIGLGLIINNKLYTGFSGYSGEFGHTIIEIDGKECPCGNHGCLEQYISERVLLQDFAERKGILDIDFKRFLSMYQTGDKDAILIVNKFIKYMSLCVNNVLNAYNPNIVIINSSFTTFNPELIGQIINSLDSKMNCFQKIIGSHLQDSSILLGGACVSIQKFLGIKYLKFNNSYSKEEYKTL